MDNVQNCDGYINIPSSQTCRSYSVQTFIASELKNKAEETTVKLRALRGRAALASCIWFMVSCFRPPFTKLRDVVGRTDRAVAVCGLVYRAKHKFTSKLNINTEQYKQATSLQMLLYIHKQCMNALCVRFGDNNSAISDGNGLGQVSIPLQYFQGLILVILTKVK
jgi:hypothetical protein